MGNSSGTFQITAGFLPIFRIPKTKEQPMNWDRVQGNWEEFKGKAQQQWGKLTNDDMDVIEGKRKELAGRLQKHYGYAQDQAEGEIDRWLKDVS
jgi:uncharacterized protein YjbJ (UPF0337 family)